MVRSLVALLSFLVAVPVLAQSEKPGDSKPIESEPNGEPKPAEMPLLNPDRPKGQQVILVSKETTRVTEPLTDDGFVDYVEYLNQRHGKGVTPETNFEVVVRRVMGSGDVDEKVRDAYYKRLGIEPPKGDDLYRDAYTFNEVSDMSPEERAKFEKSYNATLDGPWRTEDHPRMAKWLEAANEQLDLIVEGSKRKHNFTPYVVPDDTDGIAPIFGVVLPSVQTDREFARGLTIRALHRLGEKDVDGAWSDLQAIHRIARHADNGGTLIEGLVGIAIESVALQAEQHVLASPATTPARLKSFLADLEALPPLEPMADKIDRTERFMGLDAVQTFAKDGLKQFAEADGVFGESSPLLQAIGAMISNAAKNGRTPLSVDWNTTMRLLNGYYDEMVAAAREKDVDKREAMFEAMEKRLQKVHEESQNPAKMIGKIILSGKPREAIGEAIGNVLVALLLPAVQQVGIAEDRGTARLDVMRVAFALRIRHAETGDYPKSLDALAPKYLPRIPLDALTGKPLVYKPAKPGFVVYSLGMNRKDDGGRGYDNRTEDDFESDDLAVRFGVNDE